MHRRPEGCKQTIAALSSHDGHLPGTGMGSTIVFLVVRRVLRLVGLGPKPDDKDVEIAVLRHQLAVLHRQVPHPRYAPTDRLGPGDPGQTLVSGALVGLPGHTSNAVALAS